MMAIRERSKPAAAEEKKATTGRPPLMCRAEREAGRGEQLRCALVCCQLRQQGRGIEAKGLGGLIARLTPPPSPLWQQHNCLQLLGHLYGLKAN